MKRFLRKIKIAVVFLAIPVIGKSQDLSNHFSYLNNFYNLNPAFTGSQEDIEAVASYRSPWSGIKGVNNNIMVGVHSPFYTNEGIGVKMISDSRGPFKTFIAEGQYAHQIKSKSGSTSLRFGLSAGVIQRRLDMTEETNSYVDLSDPTLKDTYYNEMNYRVGFGMLFKMHGLKIGVSAPNLLESNNSISDFLIGTVTYKIKAGGNFAITPMVIYKRLPVSKDQIDGLIRAEIIEKIWFQGGYRTNQSYLAALGFKLKHFGLGYGYELHNGYLEYLSKDMHEIVMTFNIPK